MSTHTDKTWLVAYDIRRDRLRRAVHRLLRREGMAAQYSAFTVEADDTGMQRLLEALAERIDRRVDDVRAYHLPAACAVWRLGRQSWPQGATLAPAAAARLLVEVAASDTGTTSDEPAGAV